MKVVFTRVSVVLVAAATLMGAGLAQEQREPRRSGIARWVDPDVIDPGVEDCDGQKCLKRISVSASASYATPNHLWAKVYGPPLGSYGDDPPATGTSNMPYPPGTNPVDVTKVPHVDCNLNPLDHEVVVWVEFEDSSGNKWKEIGTEWFTPVCSAAVTDEERERINRTVAAKKNIVVDAPRNGGIAPVHDDGICAHGVIKPIAGPSGPIAVSEVRAKVYRCRWDFFATGNMPTSVAALDPNAVGIEARLGKPDTAKRRTWGLSQAQLTGLDGSRLGREHLFVIWARWGNETTWTYRAFRFHTAAGHSIPVKKKM